MNRTGFHNDIKYILYTEEQIKEKVEELGAILTEEYRGKDPIFVCVMKGSINFFSDLIRHFDDYCELDYLATSAYGNGTVNNGNVMIKKDLDMNITDRHVIIVEDIMDSGLTLNFVTSLLAARKPASMKIVTLLDKPERRKCTLNPDYTAFCIPDEFVVGYGLDFAQTYRNLPYVAVLKTEIIEDKCK